MEKSSFDHILIVASLVCLTCTAHVLSLSRSRTVTIMPRAGSVIVASTLPDLQRPSDLGDEPFSCNADPMSCSQICWFVINFISPFVVEVETDVIFHLPFCAREIPSTFLEPWNNPFGSPCWIRRLYLRDCLNNVKHRPKQNRLDVFSHHFSPFRCLKYKTLVRYLWHND